MLALFFYLALMAFVGYFASRRVKNLEDFFVAGRRVPFWLAVPTIVATWFGAGTCMGVSGMVYSRGVSSVLADPFGCSMALIIAGVFFTARFRRRRLLTISDILGQTYGTALEVVASLMMLPFYIGTLAAQMVALGYLLNIYAGFDPQVGMILGSTILVAYTLAGGMWAVTVTDLLQLVILAIGLGTVFVIALGNVPDMQQLKVVVTQQFSEIIPATNGFLERMALYGQLALTGFGAAMGQDLIQRSLSCKSVSVARWSAIVSAGVYLLLGMIPIVIGMMGSFLVPDLADAEMLIPVMVAKYLSPATAVMVGIGLLSALMSTADSYLLAGTSLLVQNILLKATPLKSERQRLWLVRFSGLGIAILAMVVALTTQRIFDLIVHSGALLLVAIFVPVTAALYAKRVSPSAAWAALLGGPGMWWVSVVWGVWCTTAPIDQVLYASAAVGGLAALTFYLLVMWLDSSRVDAEIVAPNAPSLEEDERGISVLPL